ncbi:hypothetical protein [Alteribacillus iranensis]|uniref:Uncharacterized protein n=1 Tax=Alteribacillus iranensis TaxID=930128 RepID=A0A1I2BK05_9BACI|nr:hypothetical protein [Alteribacillus iranensis]SFE56531.1 hypothetical protein SAMN05192532_102352 [Alteribacillus iranensis]
MKRIANSIIVVLIITFIIGQFFTNSWVTGLYTVLTALTALISLFYSRGIPKVFGSLMILVGGAVLLYQQQPMDMWVEGITRNLPLVCLVVVVPILGIPINIGQYHKHLAGITARFHQKPQRMYLFLSGLFSLIGPITNIGSLYIIHAMVEKLKLPHTLLGRVYVRGFTSVHTWSPYFASVFLVVYSLQVPIYQYLPYGLLLSVFQVLTAYVLFRFVEMRNISFDTPERSLSRSKYKLYELFAVLLLVTGFIFIFEPRIPLNASVIISLIVLFFAFLWALYLKHAKPFVHKVNDYLKEVFPNRANEVGLLLTAGFFGVVLSNTPISDHIHSVWVMLADTSVFLLIMMTTVIISVLSFIGVHQIVTISAIVATVSYDELGIPVIMMAMMLLSAWSVATTVSPVSPVVIGVSSLLKENVFRIILRWNLLYAIVLMLVHTTLIYCLYLFW